MASTAAFSEAKDFGSHGMNFTVTEKDMLETIQSKLAFIKNKGDLDRLNTEMQKQLKTSLESSKRVLGITLDAIETRSFKYYPIYKADKDLYTPAGALVYSRGDKVNSLNYHSLKYKLLFIDGENPKHIAWAQKQAGDKKIILVNGSAWQLIKQLKTLFYFDQGGVITSKLGIKQVPAIAVQEEDYILVTETVE